MLELTGFFVCLGPRHTQDVGQQPLGQPVSAYQHFGGLAPGVGEPHLFLRRDDDEPLVAQTTQHLCDGGRRDPEILGETGADHPHTTRLDLVDGLEVLLDRWRGHLAQSPVTSEVTVSSV